MDLDNAQDSGMACPRAAISEARFQQQLEREVLRNERLRAQLLAWVCGFLMLFILGILGLTVLIRIVRVEAQGNPMLVGGLLVLCFVLLLYGAASVYFLLGLAWAMAFALVEMRHPGSLSMGRPGPLVWDDFLYYSFVTLTTLGYGDITPLTQTTRSLAILEAITGVFYTTVLVARLVGLYLVRLTRQQKGKEQS